MKTCTPVKVLELSVHQRLLLELSVHQRLLLELSAQHGLKEKRQSLPKWQ